MRAFFYSRSVIFLLAGAAAVVLTLGLVVHSAHQPPSPMSETAAPPAQKLPPALFAPSLYCEFHDISNTVVVVGFDFAVALPKAAPPRFDERYEGSQDGTHTFDASHRPTWTYAHDEDATPTITSPDGATRIMLYGLKLNTGGVLIDEAGLRSNEYRNLDGQCRQANFGGSDRAVASGGKTPK